MKVTKFILMVGFLSIINFCIDYFVFNETITANSITVNILLAFGLNISCDYWSLYKKYKALGESNNKAWDIIDFKESQILRLKQDIVDLKSEIESLKHYLNEKIKN